MGTPQGSTIDAILFAIFVGPISNIIHHLGVCCNQYADDTQLYMKLSPLSISNIDELSNCAAKLAGWSLNDHMLNSDKTEAII